MTPSAREWIRGRTAGVPDELAREVRSCLQATPSGVAGGGCGAALGDAALAALDGVVEGPGSREGALRLLAADAILTYAFEAAADLGEDVLDLADRLGVRGALGARLRASPAGGRG
ncbi:MAG: hypothetical protein ACE5HF_10085 [Gemmatimonadota bacterium]